MVQDVFEQLKALQEVLEQQYCVERELEEIPKSINTKKELLARLKKLFIDKSEQLTKKQLKVRDLKSRLKDAEEKRVKFERDMDIIKTQKEYEILDKQIKDTIQEEQQLRKDLIREEKETEELNQEVERDHSLIDIQEDELRREEEKIAAESDAKRAELADLDRRKLEIIPGLDEEILFKFERIIRSKEGGHGIVPVRNGVCTACHMILPAQFVNNVRHGDSIMFCPYCSRILFYEETEEEEDIMTTDYNDDAIGGFVEYEEGTLDDEEGYDDEYSDKMEDETESFDDDDAVYDEETAEEQDELLSEEEGFEEEFEDEDFDGDEEDLDDDFDNDMDDEDEDEEDSLDEMAEDEDDDEDDDEE